MISRVINGNCLEELPKMSDASVDMVCSDPPYELNFMGKSWDNTGIAFDPKLYAELFRVLKPGGLIRMFSATRTYHRVCQAMSNAGFVDMRLRAWVYGSGFPKSLNVGKAIDKSGGPSPLHLLAREDLARAIRKARERAGMTRKQLAEMFPQYGYVTENWERTDHGFRAPALEDYDKLVSEVGLDPGLREFVRAEDMRSKQEGVSADRHGDGTVYGLAHSGAQYEATTVVAKKWEGYGTALKPAWEPIICARKPG